MKIHTEHYFGYIEMMHCRGVWGSYTLLHHPSIYSTNRALIFKFKKKTIF